MLWSRPKWLLQIIPIRRLSQATPDAFVFVYPRSIICASSDSRSSSPTAQKQLPDPARQLPFTPRDPCKSILLRHLVKTTLQNCSSDLIALSFFMWCARQTNYFHDRDTFTYMVHIVSRLIQRFTTVQGIIRQLQLVGCITKPQTFLLLIRIFWHGEIYNYAFEAFELMIYYGYSPNTFARNIVMDMLFKIGHIEVALRVLNETHLPNFLSFSIAVCNLCRLGDFTKLRDVIRSMVSKGFYPHSGTFCLLLSRFCRLGRVSEALQLLGFMIQLGIPVSVTVWNIMIDGFCKSGQLHIACSLPGKMVETGLSPNVVTLTPLIKGFLEWGMLTEAVGILESLETKGCYLDLVLCNVLIDCFSKLGRYDDALDVFSEFSGRNLVPDPYTFCSVLSTVCLSRQFILFPALVSGFAIQADLVACNSLLCYFCKAGYPAGAVQFYTDIIERGFVPDKYTFAGLLDGLCRSGRIDEAVNVYHGIVRSHPCVDAHMHTIMVHRLIKAGHVLRALGLFKEAVDAKLPMDTVAYNVAISGYLILKRTGEAYALFRQMKEVGVSPNAQTYNLILSALFKNKDLEVIKIILMEMVDNGAEFDFDTVQFVRNYIWNSFSDPSMVNWLNEFQDYGLLWRLENYFHTNIVGNGGEANNVLLDPTPDVLDMGTSSSDELHYMTTSVG